MLNNKLLRAVFADAGSYEYGDYDEFTRERRWAVGVGA